MSARAHKTCHLPASVGRDAAEQRTAGACGEAELLAILSKSLDEEQASVARAYYRERAEQRKKELENYRARTGDAPCTIIQF